MGTFAKRNAPWSSATSVLVVLSVPHAKATRAPSPAHVLPSAAVSVTVPTIVALGLTPAMAHAGTNAVSTAATETSNSDLTGHPFFTVQRNVRPKPLAKTVQVRLRILMPPEGQGMGPVTEAGQRVQSLSLLGVTRVSLRQADGATASDCAAARSPFTGEQSIAGHANEIVEFGVRYASAVSRPYLRSRPYSCVRVSPSRFAALDLLPRISRITCLIV